VTRPATATLHVRVRYMTSARRRMQVNKERDSRVRPSRPHRKQTYDDDIFIFLTFSPRDPLAAKVGWHGR